MQPGTELGGDVERVPHRRRADVAGDERHVPDAPLERLHEHGLLALPVGGDHDRGIGRLRLDLRRVSPDHVEAGRAGELVERPGDRGVADDDHPRRRQLRFEEELDRAAREARIVRHDGSFGRVGHPRRSAVPGHEA